MMDIKSGIVEISILMIKDVIETKAKEQKIVWVAQGLDYDITAQGKTPQEADAAFDKIVRAHITKDLKAGKIPFEGMPKAPKEIWDMFQSGLRITSQPEPIYVPENDYRASRQTLAFA